MKRLFVQSTYVILLFSAELPFASDARAAGRAIVSEWDAARIWDIDLATGQVSNPRTGTSRYLMDVEFDDAGTLYGLSGPPGVEVGLYKINLVTGGASLIGTRNTSQKIYEGDLAWDSASQQMYAVQGLPTLSFRNLLTFDTQTGQVAVIGNLTSNGGDFSALSFDGTGNLYALETQQDQIWKINKATAGIISITPLAGDIGNGAGMDWDPVSGKMYIYDGVLPTLPSNLYEVNVSTGALVLLGSNGMQNGNGIAFLPVPEPLPTSMLGLVIALAIISRRSCAVWCHSYCRN
jgi:hypothetical protein